MTAAVSAGPASANDSAAPVGGTGLIAPVSTCANQDRLDAPTHVLNRAMRCLTDFARREAGLEGLASASALERSALRKSADVLRCDDFSHFACGRDFTHWMRASGYTSVPCWRVGENLAWGERRQGTVRTIFRAWMRSPGHRENILGDFAQIGVSVKVGLLAGQPGTHVWTQHFGRQCSE